MKGYRRLLHISWTEHKTNEFVCRKVVDLAGDQESLLSIVKRRKLMWFGPVTRHDSLAKTIMQGFVEGTRRKGRSRKDWIENIFEWTGCELQNLLRLAEDREEWKRQSATISRKLPYDPGGFRA